MKRRTLVLVITLALVGVSALHGRAADAEPPKADPELPTIAIAAFKAAPVIDGKLDDGAWKAAKESNAFRDEYAFPVKETTTFLIGQKDDVIYIGIRARYDGGKKGTYGTWAECRDATFWMAESMELFLDPDLADTPAYYHFAVDHAGSRGDWFHPQPDDSEAQWDPDYQVASHWTEDEWTVEYAIPLAAFSRTETVYENFRMNITRGLATWAPLRGEKFHVPHRYGEVVGLTGTGVTPNTPGLYCGPWRRVSRDVIRVEPETPVSLPGTPVFVKGPDVKAAADKVEIAFEADVWTDVAVWIEDAGGERVRHLAAGRLGPNAPTPLTKNSLSQKLVWDRKDDWGKPLPKGPYTVKVGLGSEARLEKVIGHEPGTRDIVGITVDEQGNLYAFGGQRDQWAELTQFDRNGTYRKMILPPPAHLKPEQLRGMNIIDLGADGQVRFGSVRLTESLPGLSTPAMHTLLRNSRGQLILCGVEYPSGPARLFKVNADGSLPDDFLGPYIKEMHWVEYHHGWAKRLHMAFDPDDENLIYLSGLKETHRSEYQVKETDNPRTRYYNAVCRIRWDREAPPEVVAGTLNYSDREGSSKPGEFFDPQGIAFDADKNLWVADRDNNRIQVFDRSGTFLWLFETPRPYQIAFGRNGEVYVMGAENGEAVVSKYTAGKKPTLIAKTTTLGPESYWRTFALDVSGKKPELKIVKPLDTGTLPYQVERLVDNGKAFGAPEVIVGHREPRNYDRITAGWDNDMVWSGGYWFDGKTGEEIRTMEAQELLSSRDGTWVHKYGFLGTGITIYPSELPWKDVEPVRSFQFDPLALQRAGPRGFTVAPNGDIYKVRYYQFIQQSSGRVTDEEASFHCAIDVYTPEGELKHRRIVYELSQAAHAPAVDIKGNIYVVDNIGRRIGQLYEPDIAGHLPKWMIEYDIDWEALREGREVHAGYEKFVWNPLIQSVGTLYKFGPKGGGLLWRAAQKPQLHYKPIPGKKWDRYPDWGYPAGDMPDPPATHWSAKWVGVAKTFLREGLFPVWHDGVEWEFLGVGSSWGRYNLWHSGCTCYNIRICVDDFGRVFAPAAHRNTVRMVDTAGNELLRIGRYANPDGWTGDAPRPETEIPMRLPHATALSKRYLYVAEARYGRILQIKLGYKTEHASAIPE